VGARVAILVDKAASKLFAGRSVVVIHGEEIGRVRDDIRRLERDDAVFADSYWVSVE
jgi:hypothetical protein